MNASDIWTDLCEKYSLGKILGAPQRVHGGLLHRMYHVTTDTGEYAVKLLDPDIMKRPQAIGNMIHSERIAERLAQDLNAAFVVTALEREGQQLLSLDTEGQKQYIFIYPWVTAHSLFAPEVSVSHCSKIGRILGQIHRVGLTAADLELPSEDPVRLPYDWQGYLALAKKKQAYWLSEYESMLPDLTRWDRAATAAMPSVAAYQIVSHRDLDPKNVLWQGEQPYLIDWEAAGAVNPYQELLEVLNYWAADQDGRLDSSLCQALLRAYADSVDLRRVDWTPILAVSCDSMLGWLEYNLKIGLGIENGKKPDGIRHMADTYRELLRYEKRSDSLLTELFQAV